MKKLTEEEIQQMLAEHFLAKENKPIAAPIADEELNTYKQLFTVLATPPAEGLPLDFSAKLHRKLQQQLQHQDKIRFYSTWALVFVVVMTALYLGFMLMDRTYQTNVTEKIAEHKWFFLLAFPLLFLIQYLDHISIKEHQLKKNNEQKNN